MRLALASAFLLTSVACGWIENVDPPLANSEIGNEGTATPPPSDDAQAPQTPTTPPPPVDPPAVAAYAVRWNPSTSAGIIGYELTVRVVPSGSTRTIDIPLSAARSVGGNVLQHEINLETDHDHLLSLRAYDGSKQSPPSNEIVVRASALIASAMGGAPSAATAGGSESGAATSTASTSYSSSSPSAVTASSESAGSADATASAEPAEADARELAASIDMLASIELNGAGDHLEGAVVDATERVMAGFDAATLSVWMRPLLDDAPRRVVVSLAAGADAGFDAFELAVIEGGDVELTLRDDAGRIGRRVHFAAALESDVWQHVSLVVDARAEVPFMLHVDGVEAPAAAVTVADPGVMSPVGLLRIGAGFEGESFAGRLGHVALWSRALESDELLFASIQGHGLDLRSDAIGAELAHYWRLGEGDGAFELDLAGPGMPIDLSAPSAELVLVEDGPLPLE